MNSRTCGTPVCPGCEQSTAGARFIGTRGVLSLWRCVRCGLAFTDRSLWRDPYLERDYYGARESNLEELRARPTATHHERMDFVQRWLPHGRLLDYGGGLGETAVVAAERGFQALVLEDSARAIEAGSSFFPHIGWIHGRAIPGTLPDVSLDVLTAFHVMEHLPEPRFALRQFHRVLKPGGFLCIEVPNWGSHLRRLQGLRWHFVLDHHVNYFDRHTLDRTVEPVGFRRVGHTYRRTFAINEEQRWKEPLKSVLCQLGFGDILRVMYRKS